MDLAEIIKEYRQENNLSQRQFATRCGLSNAYISKIEASEEKRRAPYKIETLTAIARGMRISLEELLEKTGNIKINIEKKPLVNDDEELTEYLEYLRDRADLRMLFSVSKDATTADVKRAVKYIESLKEIY